MSSGPFRFLSRSPKRTVLDHWLSEISRDSHSAPSNSEIDSVRLVALLFESSRAAEHPLPLAIPTRESSSLVLWVTVDQTTTGIAAPTPTNVQPAIRSRRALSSPFANATSGSFNIGFASAIAVRGSTQEWDRSGDQSNTMSSPRKETHPSSPPQAGLLPCRTRLLLRMSNSSSLRHRKDCPPRYRWQSCRRDTRRH